MTKKIPSADSARFTADLAEYRAARAELDSHDHQADPSKTDALYDRCATAEDRVLAQRAPDIDAVADKLMILWDEDVWSENEEGTQMQVIIGDLRVLARAQRQPRPQGLSR